jgi:hypothetical protein
MFAAMPLPRLESASECFDALLDAYLDECDFTIGNPVAQAERKAEWQARYEAALRYDDHEQAMTDLENWR